MQSGGARGEAEQALWNLWNTAARTWIVACADRGVYSVAVAAIGPAIATLLTTCCI